MRRSDFAGVPRPSGRTLSGSELQLFVDELADRPELWIGLVKHDRSQRVYEELFSDDHLTAWLICWMDEHDTGFHDHDISAGAVAVVSGRVREQRLTLDGPPTSEVLKAGESFNFSAADIHRVSHAGSDPAVTLHAYSPPLLSMGAYVVDQHGRLERRAVASSQELRPQATLYPLTEEEIGAQAAHSVDVVRPGSDDAGGRPCGVGSTKGDDQGKDRADPDRSFVTP